MNRLDNLLDMDIKKLLTLLNLGSVLNTLFSLKDEGVNTSFVDLFIPAVASQFGAGLAANSVYVQSSLSPEGLLNFLIGLLLFTVVHRISFIRYTARVCPIIGKSLFFMNLKNSTTPFYLIASWIMVAEVSGRLINKVLFNKKTIEVSSNELSKTFLLITSIPVSRTLNIPDATLFSFVFFVSVMPLVTEFIKSRAEEVKDINKHKKRTSLRSQIRK